MFHQIKLPGAYIIEFEVYADNRECIAHP